jgi:hypothetical protein
MGLHSLIRATNLEGGIEEAERVVSRSGWRTEQAEIEV